MDLIKSGVPPTVAMREAGYSEQTAQAPGRELLRSAGGETIQDLFQDAFLKVGITPVHYAQGVKELMEADKVVSARVVVYKQDGTNTERQLVDANERTDDFIEVPDFQARAKGLELYRRDMGMEQQTVNQQTNVQVNFGGLKDQYKKGE